MHWQTPGWTGLVLSFTHAAGSSKGGRHGDHRDPPQPTGTGPRRADRPVDDDRTGPRRTPRRRPHRIRSGRPGRRHRLWPRHRRARGSTSGCQCDRRRPESCHASTRAADHLARRRERRDVIEGTAEALPLPDQSTDVVSALSSLHHWTDHARAHHRGRGRTCPDHRGSRIPRCRTPDPPCRSTHAGRDHRHYSAHVNTGSLTNSTASTILLADPLRRPPSGRRERLTISPGTRSRRAARATARCARPDPCRWLLLGGLGGRQPCTGPGIVFVSTKPS